MYFGKSCSSRLFLASQICYFNAIRENKILAKISGFTVFMTRVNKFSKFDVLERIIRKGLFHWARQTWGLEHIFTITTYKENMPLRFSTM